MAFIYDLTDTWNAGGTTFNAIKMNVTDTASAAASKLVTLQVGGSERFGVDKTGIASFAGAVRGPLGSVSAPAFSFTGDTNTGMWSPAADTLAFSEGGVEVMRIDSSGQVGIGTTSPFNRLSVVGPSEFSLGITARASSTQTGLLNHPVMVLQNSSSAAGNGLNLRYQIADTGSVLRTTGGVGMVATAKDASSVTADMYFYTGTSERMRITSSGNVGIGTSAPSFPLQVNGGLAAGRTTSQYVSITGDASFNYVTGVSQVGNAKPFLIASDANSTALIFGTLSVERMRIDNSGNVGIGTTAPASLLHLQANDPRITFRDTSGTSAATNYFQIGQAGANGEFCFLSADPNNVQANTVMQFSVDGSERMRIDSAGNLLVGKTTINLSTVGIEARGAGILGATRDGGEPLFLRRNTSDGAIASFNRDGSTVGTISVTTTATTYNTSSDYRLKDIDGPIQDSGAYIDALKPVQGRWKADGSRFIGLLAHEVQEVSETQIATGEKDGEEMQAMDYSAPEIIANLIAEIQSLRARVAQLEGN